MCYTKDSQQVVHPLGQVIHLSVYKRWPFKQNKCFIYLCNTMERDSHEPDLISFFFVGRHNCVTLNPVFILG